MDNSEREEPIMRFNCGTSRPIASAAPGCRIILENWAANKDDPEQWQMGPKGFLTTWISARESTSRAIEKSILESEKKVSVPEYPATIGVSIWEVPGAKKRIWMISRSYMPQGTAVQIDERHFLISEGTWENAAYTPLHAQCTIGSPGHMDNKSLFFRSPKEQDSLMIHDTGSEKILMIINYGDQMWPWALFYPERFLAIAELQELHDVRRERNALKALSKDSNALVRYAVDQHVKEARTIIDKTVLELIRSL